MKLFQLKLAGKLNSSSQEVRPLDLVAKLCNYNITHWPNVKMYHNIWVIY